MGASSSALSGRRMGPAAFHAALLSLRSIRLRGGKIFHHDHQSCGGLANIPPRAADQARPRGTGDAAALPAAVVLFTLLNCIDRDALRPGFRHRAQTPSVWANQDRNDRRIVVDTRSA